MAEEARGIESFLNLQEIFSGITAMEGEVDVSGNESKHKEAEKGTLY